MKASPWDLPEFDQAAISNLDAVQGSSIIEKLMDTWNEPGVAIMAQLASGSSKRASCLVDGCISDLSNGKEYHRRHKVCAQHSKAPQVMIRGHTLRFCQQCNRFHTLEEFDEGKRSCRKRLDRHNRRRRIKSQPKPILHAGSSLSNFQGSQLLPFSNAQVYPMNTEWTSTLSSDEDVNRHQRLNLLDQRLLFSRSSSSIYKGGDKKLTAVQCHSLTLNNFKNPSCRTTYIHQSIAMNIALPETGHDIFCNRLMNAVQNGNCSCSCSHLSMPQSHTSGLSLVLPDSIPLASMDSVLVPSEIHYQGSFNLSSDESSGNNVFQTFPFLWE